MKFTNKHNLPMPVVQAVMKGELSDDVPLMLGGLPVKRVSTINDSPRRAQLTQRHWDEIEVDVSDCLWLLLGNSMHVILEEAATNQFQEERMFAQCGDTMIAGKVDLMGEDDAETDE